MGEEEVYAHEALTAQGVEGGGGGGHEQLALGGGDAGGADHLDGVVGQVLGLEVIELTGALGDVYGDLAGLGHAGGVVAAPLKDGDLDITSDDAGLHEDLGIDGTGRLNGAGKVLRTLDLADAQGGTGAGGLDEQGDYEIGRASCRERV